jgi:hypothetical protein
MFVRWLVWLIALFIAIKCKMLLNGLLLVLRVLNVENLVYEL